jgi:hypothetical protein
LISSGWEVGAGAAAVALIGAVAVELAGAAAVALAGAVAVARRGGARAGAFSKYKDPASRFQFKMNSSHSLQLLKVKFFAEITLNSLQICPIQYPALDCCKATTCVLYITFYSV